MTARPARVALLLCGALGYAALQVWGRRGMSCPDERRRALPGDTLVAAPSVVTDHAITIAATPVEIWPWLTQMGWHRAGWYTPRWVDRLLFPANWASLKHLDPALVRDLAVGDTIPDGQPGTAFFRVEQVAAPHVLVLHSTTHLPASWRERFGAGIDWTWTFVLEEQPHGRTRLHLRVRGHTWPWWLTASYAVALVPADGIMGPGMLRGIRRRVETSSPERIGPGDLMQLASDVGPVPMNVGALLVLDVAPDFDLAAAQAELGRRLGAVRRLRQRLVRLPWVLGRPIWVDHPNFDPATHVTSVRCRPPGDRSALLESAVSAVTTALPQSKPLWRAVFITGLADGRVGLVLALHHVIADGVGGLAVLAALADSAAGRPPDGMPAGHPPTATELFTDAARTRLAAISRTPQALTRLWQARAELGLSRVELAPRCSLNAPTGPRRKVGTVTVDLNGIRDLADRHSATVNDVLLTAVTGAMASGVRATGEHPPALVISVPISARTATTATDLGNRVGVMPVRVPMVEPAEMRLRQVADLTRMQRTTHRGSSASLVGPLFRMLAAVGLLRWFVDRQRLVNSFLTNIRGPAEHLRFTGVEVDEVVPITVTAGNVTVAFAALSYAGTLTVAVIVDPDRIPDVTTVTNALQAQLDTLGVESPPRVS